MNILTDAEIRDILRTVFIGIKINASRSVMGSPNKGKIFEAVRKFEFGNNDLEHDYAEIKIQKEEPHYYFLWEKINGEHVLFIGEKNDFL